MARLLLAYNGQPKAIEALFLAAYLAGRWQVPLTVLAIEERDLPADERLGFAEDYLTAQGLGASYFRKDGPVVERVLGAFPLVPLVAI